MLLQRCEEIIFRKKWLEIPRSGEALLPQKAGHATASVVVHKVVELTIVYVTKCRSGSDARSLLPGVGHVDVLLHRPNVGDGPGKMYPSMNGCAMSSRPNRGGVVVDFQSVSPDEMVGGLVLNDVKERDVLVVPCVKSRQVVVSVGLARCFLGCPRWRRLQRVLSCSSPL